MTTWHATTEWTADAAPDPADVAEELVDALGAFHVGVVMVPDEDLGRWSTTITVEASTIRQANEAALAAITAAARHVGQRRVQILGLDVVDDAGFEQRLQRPNIPDLVGFAGSARIGKMSNTRARKLYETHPAHPRLLLDIEGYGPLFVRSEIERFHANREPMKPGPKAKTTDGAEAIT